MLVLGRRARRSRALPAMLAVLATVGVALVPATPASAGGPVQVGYPSASCPQEHGLQGCIDSLEAGSTITIHNEIVPEDIHITGDLRLLGDPELRPRLDSIRVDGTTPKVDVLLRDLRVGGGIWGIFDGTPGHRLTAERVRVLGAIPNTGAGITFQTRVPATFNLLGSTITTPVDGRESVAFDANLTGGRATFRAVGNRVSQRGANGSAGMFIRHQGAGELDAKLFNNRIWDTGRCGCGLSAAVAVAVDGTVQGDVAIVGNTIVRSAGGAIHLRNDTTAGGSLVARIYNDILAWSPHAAISRATLTGATTTVQAGWNNVYRTASNPRSALFGPHTRGVDPRFVDRVRGDLRLRSTSPLIDAGVACSPAGTADPDAAGKHRLAGRDVDIGAYEARARTPDGVVITGDDSPEFLRGTSGADIICGLGGDDLIEGRGGPDLLDGGPGEDGIVGGMGRDLLFGRSGNDRMCAVDEEPLDRVNGGPGTDTVLADRGDILVSVNGADSCVFN